MIKHARLTGGITGPLRAALTTMALLVSAAAVPAWTGGSALAAPNGFVSVCPNMTLQVGQDAGQVCRALATTGFEASYSVAGTPNPTVDWGDGTVDTLPTPPGAPLTMPTNCIVYGPRIAQSIPWIPQAVNCLLSDDHAYSAPGIYTITVTYYTGFAISYRATLRAAVSDTFSSPLGRYYAPGVSHWVTTGPATQDYNLETILGYTMKYPQYGTVPIYECLDGSVDHFVSLDPGCEGRYVVQSLGYLYSTPSPYVPTTALYRCYTGVDHFVSTDPSCEGQWTEELLGYALVQPGSQPAPAPSQHW
jgi:hypothetical protein